MRKGGFQQAHVKAPPLTSKSLLLRPMERNLAFHSATVAFGPGRENFEEKMAT